VPRVLVEGREAQKGTIFGHRISNRRQVVRKYKEPTPEALAKAICTECMKIGGLILKSENIMECTYCGYKYYKIGTVVDK
jgi:ribosomal protein L37AE/L43A